MKAIGGQLVNCSPLASPDFKGLCNRDSAFKIELNSYGSENMIFIAIKL